MEATGIKINPESDIDEIRRIGKPRDVVERLTILKLTTGSKKIEILKQSKKLKSTKIWIDEDYPKEMLRRGKIVSSVKKGKKQGLLRCY